MHSPTSGGQVCFAQQLVCEIVAFAVVKHGYRAKALATELLLDPFVKAFLCN